MKRPGGVVKDWRAIARAGGLEVSERDLERIAGPLETLEEAFRPLAKELKAEDEPATAFHAEETE